MNDRLEYEYTYQPLIRHYAVSGFDKKKNEVVIKLVNGENTPWNTSINLTNVKSVKSEGTQITLSSVNPDDENSFANPEKVVPVETVLKGLKPSFDMVCQPNSFTILRIPVE